MKILNNIILSISSLIFGLLSYPFLEMSINIINNENQLVGLVTGFLIVPIAITMFVASVICAFIVFITGLIHKKPLWWILGIILLLIHIGAVVYAFVV